MLAWGNLLNFNQNAYVYISCIIKHDLIPMALNYKATSYANKSKHTRIFMKYILNIN